MVEPSQEVLVIIVFQETNEPQIACRKLMSSTKMRGLQGRHAFENTPYNPVCRSNVVTDKEGAVGKVVI
jgi:hypothetical protein